MAAGLTESASVTENLDGWLIIDKPSGMTSNDVLTKLKHVFGKIKIGHTGTLDPLATGVLPVALGKATKLIPYISNHNKSYTFTVKWGAATTTDDSQGEIIKTSDTLPTKEQISAILPQFTGEIMQTPPIYSAVKIDGKRAYALARQGENPEIEARQVTIDSLNIISFDSDLETTFSVKCSQGTYVRSLARDMGEKLGSLGHITSLRRTQSGKFLLKDTILLENFLKIEQIADACEFILPLNTVLDDIPALALSVEELQAVSMGMPIPALPLLERLDIRIDPDKCVQLAYKGQLYAIAVISGTKFQPVKVF